MSAALSIIAIAICGMLLLPTVADAWSLLRCLASWFRPHARRDQHEAPSTPSRLLFLIPAHNEELLIADCVRSVLAQQYPRTHMRVVVVADNCTDHTADIARRWGTGQDVECLERHAAARGKPRAIAWALEQLDLAATDAVVIVDADVVVDPMFAAELQRAAPLAGKVVQPYNDVRNPRDGALTRMAAVFGAGLFRGAYALKQRAGLNIPLGVGMCIGTQVLARHPWRAFTLSEDWELYAQLTAAGIPIVLATRAHLYAQEATTLQQSAPQRTRWWAGRIEAVQRNGPGLLRSNRAGWHAKLDVIASLTAPGPATHLGIAAMLMTLLFVSRAAGAPIIAAALLVSLLRPACYALIGLWLNPEPVRAVRAFFFLPFYACWRVMLALTALWPSRHRVWTRTARE